MSRPLLLCRSKIQNSEFLFCTTDVDPMSRPLRRKIFVTASFQLVLTIFNIHLMISNGTIFSPDLSLTSIEDIKALKGGKKQEIQTFISALSKRISSSKKSFQFKFTNPLGAHSSLQPP